VDLACRIIRNVGQEIIRNATYAEEKGNLASPSELVLFASDDPAASGNGGRQLLVGIVRVPLRSAACATSAGHRLRSTFVYRDRWKPSRSDQSIARGTRCPECRG